MRSCEREKLFDDTFDLGEFFSLFEYGIERQKVECNVITGFTLDASRVADSGA